MVTTDPLFDVSGRVAIVTGASSGLGAHFARVLASRGAAVVASGRRVRRLEALAGEIGSERCLALAGDITDTALPDRLVAAAADRFGRVDILVNNAGAADGGPAEQQDISSFREIVDLDLTAAFTCARAVAGVMLPQGAGSIINIASIAAQLSLSERHPMAAYVAAKSGLVGLTRELAAQWGARGVRVNAIAPGWFATELTGGLRDRAQVAWIQTRTALGRPGRLEELDGALIFLASDASSYVIGQTLVVDGGWTVR